MSDYPDYLRERDYYDSILGPPVTPQDSRDYGDNDPSDPEQNIDEENEL